MPRERHLIVAAHPDDETIGLGGHLAAASLPGAAVAFATDGAPANGIDASRLGLPSAEAYAERRFYEARSALELAGVTSQWIFRLGGSDSQLVEQIGFATQRLADLIQLLDATVVWTHAYEGGHPDHDATAVCVHAALALLARKGGPQPELRELTSYHIAGSVAGSEAGSVAGSDAPEWGTFLAPNQAIAGEADPTTVRVFGDPHRLLKRRMLARYDSQKAILGAVPVDAEATRRAPRYHFDRAPHAGPLLYERLSALMGQTMSGETWRSLAAKALAELGLEAREAL